MFVNWDNFQINLCVLHNWTNHLPVLYYLYDYTTTLQFCLEKALFPWYAFII